MVARVFISCGQAKGTDEEQIATQIADRLAHAGFQPYVAVAEQTLAGLTQNIFWRLRNSEYFVFIDFKRELLGGIDVHRGSLFSHQELAIAAFLNFENLVAFQEAGVKTDDGMIRFLQANAVQFADRTNLPDIVFAAIKLRGWNASWRRELILERVPNEFADANIIGPNVPARFFHIRVSNRHRERLASNCYVYLERVKQLPDTNIPLKTVEFKWAGTRLAGVGIVAGGSRDFDAFHLLHQSPTQIQFNALADATDYFPEIPPNAGNHELSYVVVSDNFPPARGTFTLHLDAQLENTTFS
jgi:hypothetical protein